MSFLRLLSFFLFMSVVTVNSKNIEYDLINSLHDILNFTFNNDALLDTNMLFGISIISGQLQALSNYKMNTYLRDRVSELYNLCRNIFEIGLERNVANIRNDKTQKILFCPELWNFDNAINQLTMPSSFHFSLRENSITEKEFRDNYEICLRNLVEKCYSCGHCFKLIILIRKGGYVLTHQILYLHVMKQLILKSACAFVPMDIKDLNLFINEKCYQTFIEVQIFTKESNLDQRSLDLLLEEVVVCGLQNYVEFFDPKLAKFIFEYQIPMYTSVEKSNNFDSSESYIHLMSVRAAAITLYLKHIITSGF